MLVPAERDVGVGGKIGQLETFDLRPREIGPVQIGAEKPRIVEVGGKEARIRAVAFREIAVAQIAVLEYAVAIVAGTERAEHHGAMREGHSSDTPPSGAIDFGRKLNPDSLAFDEPRSKRGSAGHGVVAEIALLEFDIRQVRLHPSAAAVFRVAAKGAVGEHGILKAASTETAIDETRIRDAGGVEIAIDERALTEVHLVKMILGNIDAFERDILCRLGSPYRLFELHGQ